MSCIPEKMQAMCLVAYDKLELREVDVPKPGVGEVLCRIRSVAICGSDPKMIHGHYKYANWPPYFPFIMGHEWAGEVVALGEGVTEFKVGDRVAGEAHSGCGFCDNCKRGKYTVCLNYGKDGKNAPIDTGHRHYGFYWQGANAEYNVYKTKALHLIPENVSFDEASLCDCGGVALHGVELAGVTKDGTSVVLGPGPIGLCAMMECKALGSKRVIVVGRGAKLEKARELGADVCIDFEKEDVVARVLEETKGVGADEVMECSGSPDSLEKACRMVRKAGSVAVIANYKTDLISVPGNIINFNEIHIVGSKANPNVSEKVLKMLSEGKIKGSALVTHKFALKDYVKAVDVFEHKLDGSIKVVVNP